MWVTKLKSQKNLRLVLFALILYLGKGNMYSSRIIVGNLSIAQSQLQLDKNENQLSTLFAEFN